MPEHEAYDLGYDAYWEGADESDNPFDAHKEPENRLAWDEGWRKARADDYDESDGGRGWLTCPPQGLWREPPSDAAPTPREPRHTLPRLG